MFNTCISLLLHRSFLVWVLDVRNGWIAGYTMRMAGLVLAWFPSWLLRCLSFQLLVILSNSWWCFEVFDFWFFDVWVFNWWFCWSNLTLRFCDGWVSNLFPILWSSSVPFDGPSWFDGLVDPIEIDWNWSKLSTPILKKIGSSKLDQFDHDPIDPKIFNWPIDQLILHFHDHQTSSTFIMTHLLDQLVIGTSAPSTSSSIPAWQRLDLRLRSFFFGKDKRGFVEC